MQPKALRVALAQSGARLPALADAFTADAEVELLQVGNSPEELWRRIITLSPDVTVLYAPAFGENDFQCVSRVLRGTYSRILVLTEHSAGLLALRDPKLETYLLSGRGAAPIAEIVSRAKYLAQRKRPGETGAAASYRQSQFAPKVFYTGPAMSAAALTGQIVAVGASTGGTEALAKLFHLLPEHMPGIVVVQHMPPVFTNMYAERLHKELPFTVTEAKDNVQIKPDTIHIAPGDRHLLVKKKGGAFYTMLGNTQKVNGHCPSVDVLFNSVADEVGWQATGILLTGMGADGAAGLLRMRNKGAYTLGQDEASSVVYGMPRKAFEYGAVVQQAALTDIPKHLLTHLLEKKGH